jgi:molecular chaperone GrpE
MGKNKKTMQKDIKGPDSPKEKAEAKTDRRGRQEASGEFPGPHGNGEESLQDEHREQEDRQESPEEVLVEKIREQEDKYLRLAAEFDNYRKRTLREKADLTKHAGADLISDLLPVIDDLDRAVEAMSNTSDAAAIKKGIELIHGKFRDFLASKGVREIRATGSEFDTDFHEAVTKIPAPAKKYKGKIVDVIEKGYLMNDRVIRYAKVVVGE